MSRVDYFFFSPLLPLVPHVMMKCDLNDIWRVQCLLRLLIVECTCIVYTVDSLLLARSGMDKEGDAI